MKSARLRRSVVCDALAGLLGGQLTLAVAQAPSVQQQLQPLIESWSRQIISVPAKPVLGADMAARLPALGAELQPLLAAAGARWLGELTTAMPGATAGSLYLPLMARLNHELVSWMVSSPGTAREGIEWKLAQQPGYCRERSSLHEDQWALLADRLLFMQPLQGAEREAAIAAERQRWQLWLAGGLKEAGTPTLPPQLQALQAAERQRGDEPVSPHAMSPWLSRMTLGERPPKPYGGLMQECALVQWWLINEVARTSLSPPEAMRLFRFGTLPASENLLYMPPETRRLIRTSPAGSYPPIAQRFEVTGTVTATVLLDATGRLLEAQITSRQLSMPGLAPGRAPAAYEQELDRASFARLRATRFDTPAATDLNKGVARKEVQLAWRLD